MSRRKKIKVVRRKNEFSRALQSAKAVLKIKTKQKNAAMNLLRELNVDIPNLERTVRALEQQLGGTGAVRPLTSQPDNKKVGGVPPVFFQDKAGVHEFDGENVKTISEDIPPDILAKLPPDDFSKFGSHFGTEAAQEEDTLPEITGKPLIPEKA